MKFFITTSLLLILSICSQAQIGGSASGYDAQSIGMANTYTAASTGVFAIGKNPANLSFSDNGRFEVQTNIIPLPFPSISFGAGTDFLSINDYNYFFGGVPDPANPGGKKIGRFLTAEDKNRLVSMFEDGGTVSTGFSMPLLKIFYKAGDKAGAFGFSISDNFAMEMKFPKGLANFAMNGNSADTLTSFSDGKFTAWYLRDISLSYSRDINELLTNTFNMPQNLFQRFSFGISFKYVTGLAYAGSDNLNASMITSSNQIMFNSNSSGLVAVSPDFGTKYDFDSLSQKKDANMGPFPASAGSGIGIDIGFTAQLNDALIIGFALTDLGNITWNTNAAKFTYNSSVSLTDLSETSQRDTAQKRIKEYKGEYISEFSTSLPGALRIGASYQLDKDPVIGGLIPGKLLIAMDFNMGFNDMPGNSTKPRVSLGTEWKPMDWVPFIRTGLSFGGNDSFNWAFGLGFNAGVFDLGIATRDFQYMFSNDIKRTSIALDTRWKF
ncbi:MAG: DUF5723 family protein [Ignavibacteria bacterium]